MSDHNPLIVDLDLISPLDTSASVNGAGELVLSASAGAAAGDPGSTASFVVNVKFKKNATAPDGHATLLFHRTEADGVRHTYQVKATTVLTFLRTVATGEALLTATATITDITARENPIVLHTDASLRATLDDNGNPGVLADTIAVTVLDDNAGLWFSSNGSGVAAPQVIVGGNLHVR